MELICITGKPKSGKTTFCRGKHNVVKIDGYGNQRRTRVASAIFEAERGSIIYLDGFPRNNRDLSWLEVITDRNNVSFKLVHVYCEENKRMSRVLNEGLDSTVKDVSKKELMGGIYAYDLLFTTAIRGLAVDFFDTSFERPVSV